MQKQTLAPNANKRVVNPLSGYLQGLILIVIDRKTKILNKIKVNKLQQGIFDFNI